MAQGQGLRGVLLQKYTPGCQAESGRKMTKIKPRAVATKERVGWPMVLLGFCTGCVAFRCRLRWLRYRAARDL